MFASAQADSKSDSFVEKLKTFYTTCVSESIDPKKTAQGRVVFSDTHILKVDKQFKSQLSSIKQSSGISIISTEEHHPEISQLKIKYLDNIPGSNETGFLVRFIVKGSGKKVYFYVSDSTDDRYDPNNYCKQIDNLKRSAPIEKLETTLSKIQRQSANVFPLEKWGDDWEEGRRNQAVYNCTSDPMILKNLDTYVFPNINGDRELIILDIGGGKGRLAEKIIHSAQQKDIKVYYILLEPIASQVNKAKERFSKIQELYKDRLIIQVIVSTLENFTKQDCYHKYVGAVDCIISSGGPLNMSIVTQSDAQKNLAVMHGLLTKDGKIIVNGLTHTLVNKKDFHKCGFTLFNMSARIIDVDGDPVVKQDYVARKNNTI